jgi:hypothetical protein
VAKVLARKVLLLSLSNESDIAVNDPLDEFLTVRSGVDLTALRNITVTRAGKSVIFPRILVETFEDDPIGLILRLTPQRIRFFGFTIGERIDIEFDGKQKVITLRSSGAK